MVHSTTSTVKNSLPARRQVNILIGTWHYSLFSKSNLTIIGSFLCVYYPLEAVSTSTLHTSQITQDNKLKKKL